MTHPRKWFGDLQPEEVQNLEYSLYEMIRRDPWAINTPARLANALFDQKGYAFNLGPLYVNSIRADLILKDKNLRLSEVKAALRRLVKQGKLTTYEGGGIRGTATNYITPEALG
jgi:hypothetical protein